jgi:ankyrin repeat protein
MNFILNIDFRRYPELQAYLESDPPNVHLLYGQMELIYRIDVVYRLTLTQVCSLYGKPSHIHALELSADEEKDEIKAHDYLAIRVAAGNGHQTTIEYLERHLAAGEKKEAVKAVNYKAIQWASEKGHLTTIKYLLSHLTAEEKKEAVKAVIHQAIEYAARSGHHSIVQYLLSHFSAAEKKEAIKKNLDLLSLYGNHITTIKYVERFLTAIEVKEVIKAYQYSVIRNASKNGDLTAIKYFERYLTSDEKKKAAMTMCCTAIQAAAKNGHNTTIEHLLSHLTTAEKKEVIKTWNYYSIQLAVGHGQLTTIQLLESHLTAAEKKEAFIAKKNQLIQVAAESGNNAIIKYLERHLTTAEKKEAVKADNYLAIRKAAEKGHLATIQYLERHLTTAEKKEAVKAENYLAIQKAAEKGHLATIQYLERHLTTAEKKEAVKAENYLATRMVAANGHHATIQYLENHLTTAEKKQAVKAEHYSAISWAAEKGHLTTIQYLESHLNAAEKNEAIKAGSYTAIRLAFARHHQATVRYYLNNECAFAYLESHGREYGEEYVYPWMRQKIEQLKQTQLVFESEHPNEVFTVTEPDARIGYYMIRNIIRRGVARERAPAEELLDELRFLLSIPGVRVLCHQRLDEEGQENELLRLATRIGNSEAASILLGLPEVRRIAEQYHYYEEEAQGDIDLRQLAQDRESSMVALSVSEKETVDKVKQHYQESIKQSGGIDALFLQLKNDLKQRYGRHPAKITVPIDDSSGVCEEIALPFEWDELQVLRQCLTSEQYKEALKAYYQHEAHTAYRYLSKPNHWMSTHASYVYVCHDENGQITPLRYSTFEEYQHLIALFYYAACDKETPSLNGYTLKSRITLFIKQIALIGRAHNWDKSRHVLKDGVIQYDKKGREVTEEYDDLRGDKPSCYSGVNRRLFQSVLGHGLFMIVNYTLVRQALNEQIRNYFTKEITLSKCTALKQAYEGLVDFEGDANVHIKTLQSIDIPQEKKQEMIELVCQQLETAYKSQFTGQKAVFIAFMQSYLNSSSHHGCDFMQFQSEVGLEGILDSQCVRFNEIAQRRQATLWAPQVISGVETRAQRKRSQEDADEEPCAKRRKCRDSDSITDKKRLLEETDEAPCIKRPRR